MEAKHTPGPWMADWLDAKNGWILDRDGNYLFQVVTADDENRFVSHPQQRANAELAASAPKLLEALKLGLRFWNEMPKGQLGKISCNIGILNDFFLKSASAIAEAERDMAKYTEYKPIQKTEPVTTEQLEAYVKRIQEAHDRRKYSAGCVFSFSVGPKYAKVIEKINTQRMVHCFIDLSTGDILKAASWNAPAKGARGNIKDAKRPLFLGDFYKNRKLHG